MICVYAACWTFPLAKSVSSFCSTVNGFIVSVLCVFSQYGVTFRLIEVEMNFDFHLFLLLRFLRDKFPKWHKWREKNEENMLARSKWQQLIIIIIGKVRTKHQFAGFYTLSMSFFSMHSSPFNIGESHLRAQPNFIHIENINTLQNTNELLGKSLVVRTKATRILFNYHFSIKKVLCFVGQSFSFFCFSLSLFHSHPFSLKWSLRLLRSFFLDVEHIEKVVWISELKKWFRIRTRE